MALPPDDQRSQHPRHVNVEIRWPYHQLGVWKFRVVVRWTMRQVLQNAHIEEVIKKANKKVFFFFSSYSVEPIFHLRILWLFIVRVLDPFLNTVCQFFIMHYLNISRRTLRGFRRGPLWECNYENNLSRFNLSSLGSRREAACSKLFNNMCIPSHKLHHLVLQRQTNPDTTSGNQVPLMFFWCLCWASSHDETKILRFSLRKFW